MKEEKSSCSTPIVSRSWVYYAVITFSGVMLIAGAMILMFDGEGRSAFSLLDQAVAEEIGEKGEENEGYKGPKVTMEEGGGWKIEAEDYDEGGEGVAYHDAFPGNILYEFNPPLKRKGEYRTDDVEIMTKNPGQRCVAFVLEGEWLNYTMEVPKTGTYDLQLNVAAIHPLRRIQFELDGEPLSRKLKVPRTGDWGKFEVASLKGGIELSEGKHTLKVFFVNSFMNVDWIRFVPMDKNKAKD